MLLASIEPNTDSDGPPRPAVTPIDPTRNYLILAGVGIGTALLVGFLPRYYLHRRKDK